MQWKPLSSRTEFIILAPILIPVIAVSFVVFLPMVLIWWIDQKLYERFGSAYKPSNEWTRWYAWRPVNAETNKFPETKWVWLETIERRNFYGRILYRFRDLC